MSNQNPFVIAFVFYFSHWTYHHLMGKGRAISWDTSQSMNPTGTTPQSAILAADSTYWRVWLRTLPMLCKSCLSMMTITVLGATLHLLELLSLVSGLCLQLRGLLERVCQVYRAVYEMYDGWTIVRSVMGTVMIDGWWRCSLKRNGFLNAYRYIFKLFNYIFMLYKFILYKYKFILYAYVFILYKYIYIIFMRCSLNIFL